MHDEEVRKFLNTLIAGVENSLLPNEIQLEKIRKPADIKILILGLPRTGTTSLILALQSLGYKTYDYPDRLRSGHLEIWTHAVEAKLNGNIEFITPELFDWFFRGRECVHDIPCIWFGKELVEAYPDAKVILTWRDPELWSNSIQKTILRHQSLLSWHVLQYMDNGFARTWLRQQKAVWGYFCDNNLTDTKLHEAKFREHYQHIKSVVSADRLLEWQVNEGWEPLCRFLGKEMPETDFPHFADGAMMQHIFLFFWKRSFWSAIYNSYVKMLSLGALAWGLRKLWKLSNR